MALDPYWSFAYGILMGLSIAAPPGPINAIIANEAAKSAIKGSSVGAGAMTADAIFFTVTYFFGRLIPSNILPYFYVVGAGLLLFLAYSVIKSSFPSRSVKGNYIVGLSMGLVNPYQISWWITVGLFMMKEISVYTIPGFFIGIVIWITTFPLSVNKLLNKPAYIEYIKLFSSGILVLFAGLMIYTVIKGFL